MEIKFFLNTYDIKNKIDFKQFLSILLWQKIHF